MGSAYGCYRSSGDNNNVLVALSNCEKLRLLLKCEYLLFSSGSYHCKRLVFFWGGGFLLEFKGLEDCAILKKKKSTVGINSNFSFKSYNKLQPTQERLCGQLK